MTVDTEIELMGTIAAGKGDTFGHKLEMGLLDEVDMERAAEILAGEGRNFLLWAACVACAPRLASETDRRRLARALPGWCLTASLARRVENHARIIGVSIAGRTWGRFPELDAMMPQLVDLALACVARRQAVSRCA